MRDKMIRNRRKSGDSVGASVDTHLDDVVVPLGVTFTQHLVEGEILPDLPTLFRILQRMLAAAVQNLVTAGSRHLREIDSDIKLRQRRDELVSLLGTKVSNFRKMLDSLFGPGSALQLAGLDGRTEQEPVALLAQIERILDRFGPDAEMASPAFRAFQMDPQAVAEDFAEYQELKDLVSELNRENRRSDATIIAKNEAMSRYNLQFRWIAGCLESLYHLADQHELAERVKPSTRRPGRTEVDVEAEEPDGPGDQPEPAEPEAGPEAGS
jgi:hypothetical protein